MAEIENRARFAEVLHAGVTSLKTHPEFKTRRKKRNAPHAGARDAESYVDKIAARVGVAPNTLKSWIGQMGPDYVPGRVEDGKLFGLLWIVLKHGEPDAGWMVRVLEATSMPVLEPPTPDWVKACLRKAKVLRDDNTFGAPREEEIGQVVGRLFADGRDGPHPPAETGRAPAGTSGRRDHAPAGGASTPEPVHVGHNLPTRWSDVFVGRRAILEALNRWLHAASPLCLLTGWSGTGKSTLALEAAYACLGKPRGEAAAPDLTWPAVARAIWISADFKGLSYSHFLDTIAYQLGKAELLGQSENGKQFVVRNALASHAADGTILLVVDNLDASDRDILAFLADLPPGTKAILTSREPRERLFGSVSRDVFAIPVDGLDRCEALEYLRREIAFQLAAGFSEHRRRNLRQLLDAGGSVLAPLTEAANGNPKALSLLVAYIADGVISADAFIRQMQEIGRSLPSLFDCLFGHTWERCGEDVRKLWMALSLFQTAPGEENWAAAAGLDGTGFHRAVDRMRAWSLIGMERPGGHPSYRAHQTVVLYGKQKMREAASFENEAKTRLAAHYLQFLERRLGRQPIDHLYWKCLPGNDYAPVKREWPNLYGLLEWCAETGRDEFLTALMMRLSHFLSRVSLPLRIRFGRLAAEAAGRLNRRLQEALFRIDTIGWACFEIGRLAEGLEQVERGLALLEDGAGDFFKEEDLRERNDLVSLGLQFKARHELECRRPDRAEALLGEAMAIPATPVIRHRALLLKGKLELLTKDWRQAAASLEEAWRVSLAYGGETSIEPHYFRGVAYLHLGEFEKAREAFGAFLPDAADANQLELIYHEYGMAQLRAAQERYAEAAGLVESALHRIESWEPDIRIRREAEALLERVRNRMREHAQENAKGNER